ncbi:MAG: Ig-like domain-containing protein [Methanobrevibacter sp.]|jgi:hypothetical protein|nr:Ig-like domain-containing protein [Candidatus Methanovirga aequatorialis]
MKRISSLIIISLMIVSSISIGGVSAKQYDYYWDFNPSDYIEFDYAENFWSGGSGAYGYTYDVNSIKVNGNEIKLPYYGVEDVIDVFTNHGNAFLNNFKDENTIVSGNLKKGTFTIKTDHWYWLDPNYYHITVKGQPKVIAEQYTKSANFDDIAEVKCRLLDENNNPMSGETVRVQYGLLQESSAVTNKEGYAVFNITCDYAASHPTYKYISFWFTYGGNSEYKVATDYSTLKLT